MTIPGGAGGAGGPRCAATVNFWVDPFGPPNARLGGPGAFGTNVQQLAQNLVTNTGPAGGQGRPEAAPGAGPAAAPGADPARAPPAVAPAPAPVEPPAVDTPAGQGQPPAPPVPPAGADAMAHAFRAAGVQVVLGGADPQQ